MDHYGPTSIAQPFLDTFRLAAPDSIRLVMSVFGETAAELAPDRQQAVALAQRRSSTGIDAQFPAHLECPCKPLLTCGSGRSLRTEDRAASACGKRLQRMQDMPAADNRRATCVCWPLPAYRA